MLDAPPLEAHLSFFFFASCAACGCTCGRTMHMMTERTTRGTWTRHRICMHLVLLCASRTRQIKAGHSSQRCSRGGGGGAPVDTRLTSLPFARMLPSHKSVSPSWQPGRVAWCQQCNKTPSPAAAREMEGDAGKPRASGPRSRCRAQVLKTDTAPRPAFFPRPWCQPSWRARAG